MCQKWGMEPGGFDEYPSGQAGVGTRFHMCFGRNWDPESRYKNPYRSDGSEPPPIPSVLTSLTETAIQDAQDLLYELPSMRPDTCSVNFYTPDGRLDLHQVSFYLHLDIDLCFASPLHSNIKKVHFCVK